MNTITLQPVKYRKYHPDGTSTLYILDNPEMYWEDEVRIHDMDMPTWKALLILSAGAALILGWTYVGHTYVLPVLDKVLP